MGSANDTKRLLRVILAVAALAAAGLPATAAEHAVGLEARGVDPMAALHNAAGLDVRDALGRPVSAAVIAKEMKAAAAGAAAASAFASRLPQAAAVTYMLELLKIARASWRAAWPGFRLGEVWALPVPLRSRSCGLPVLSLLFIMLLLRCSRSRREAAVFNACSRLPLVLRC